MKPGSKGWKSFMAKLYGIGAAIVIVGAMFKIEHWPGASLMLISGLTIEAFIFFFSAFEKVHEEPDWSLVYPELALPDEAKHSLKEQNKGKKTAIGGGGNNGGSLTAQLDNMLAEAKIEPELIASLGEGMKSFSNKAKDLSDIAESAAASSDYASALKGATVQSRHNSSCWDTGDL